MGVGVESMSSSAYTEMWKTGKNKVHKNKLRNRRGVAVCFVVIMYWGEENKNWSRILQSDVANNPATQSAVLF
jgi:hypothetical protein